VHSINAEIIFMNQITSSDETQKGSDKDPFKHSSGKVVWKKKYSHWD